MPTHVQPPPVGQAAESQHDVIAFLKHPESHSGAEVICIETHGNLVFLTGDDAYKIKRAVAFAYMDFSTLEKRRLACEREVSLNQRWAPELYLGCVPITRAEDGSLALGGQGEAVEWAVHMRRFDQTDLLSAFAAKGKIDLPLATQLACVVHAAHQSADRFETAPGIETYTSLVESLCEGLSAPNLFDMHGVEQLRAALEQQLIRSTWIINDRAAHGFVRRCHGDLHLANVVLQEGRPVLYDAIEFDERLASIDTLYDLAFLLMDLDFQGLRPAANTVLNRYLWCSGEQGNLEGLAALPLFLSLRAAVRAMVTKDRAAQEHGEARDQDIELARRYLEAALVYAVPPPSRLVLVGGLSGTGKSTLAASLAPFLGAAPGAVHLRSDLERKALAGVDEFAPLPAKAYTPPTRKLVYASLIEKGRRVLQAGHSLIIDAVFNNEGERGAAETLARACNVAVHGLWLEADAATLLARVAARKEDASDATPDVVRMQLASGIGELSPQWTVLDTDKQSGDVLHAALLALGLPKPTKR